MQKAIIEIKKYYPSNLHNFNYLTNTEKKISQAMHLNGNVIYLQNGTDLKKQRSPLTAKTIQL